MAKLTEAQRRAMLTSLAKKRKHASAAPSAKSRIARPTAKTSQEDVDIDETKEVTETKDVTDEDGKEAKRFARKLKRRAYKVAQDEHAEEIEDIVEDEDDAVAEDVADAVSDEAVEAIVDAVPEAAQLPEEELMEIVEDAVEEAVEAAVKRSAAKKKLARKARIASRAKKAETADGEISDDLVKDTAEAPALPQKDTATEVAVSDDLEEKSIAPDDTTKENGEGVKPPASVEASREKFIAALDLVKVEKAAGVLAPEAREAAVVDSYVGKYSVEAMKVAAEKLRSAGSAQRVAGVSPARHIAAKSSKTKTASARTDIGALY